MRLVQCQCRDYLWKFDCESYIIWDFKDYSAQVEHLNAHNFDVALFVVGKKATTFSCKNEINSFSKS